MLHYRTGVFNYLATSLQFLDNSPPFLYQFVARDEGPPSPSEATLFLVLHNEYDMYGTPLAIISLILK